MSKQSVWIVTGALGIVGLGAGIASAASDVGGGSSLDQSPAVQVSNFDTSSPSATPSATPSASPSVDVIDLSTTPPTAFESDGTGALTQMTSNTTVTTVSTVSPPSPVSVQSPVSAESSD